MIEILIWAFFILLYLGLGLTITSTVVERNPARKSVRWIIFLLWPLCIMIGLFVIVEEYFKRTMID